MNRQQIKADNLIREMSVAYVQGDEETAVKKARELLEMSPNCEMATMVLDCCGKLKQEED